MNSRKTNSNDGNIKCAILLSKMIHLSVFALGVTKLAATKCA